MAGAVERDDWQPKDAWLGLLFLVTGGLVLAYVLLAAHNDVPAFLWWTGVLVGPLIALLGLNAIVRSLWRRR